MKKFVVKSAIYLLLVLVLANGIAFMVSFSLKGGQFFKPEFLANGFEPEQKFKVAVFGSSRSLAALDTKLISGEMDGISANFSMDYTALPTTKLMLEHFFAQGYHAEFVVISVDLPDLNSSKTKISENDYRFFPYINEPYVKAYFEKYDEGKIKPLASSALFPFLGLGYYNMELLGPALISILKPKYRYQFDELGNYQYPDYLGLSEKPEQRFFESGLENPILSEIAELALKNSSNLVIYIAPFLRDNIQILESSPYVVINHARLIDDPKYFSDYIHVVNSGKKLATEAFIQELKKLN